MGRAFPGGKLSLPCTRVLAEARGQSPPPIPIWVLLQQFAVAKDSVLCDCFSLIAFISGTGTKCIRRLPWCTSVLVNDRSLPVRLQKCLCREAGQSC